ncbi:late embryogenesis abundant protein d-34 [Quercus suber]|uniref:Late embryogenesis abundant protein d-34 n=1 Tax=Quercus suber TaxID=58331 RepID=A0AAW0KNA1_QUESU
MSQGQPQRPRDYQSSRSSKQEAIKYGDVFSVSGDLASKPIAPRTRRMQPPCKLLRTWFWDKSKRPRPAAVKKIAASVNERVGAAGHHEATDIARNEGVTVQETQVGGTRVITEEVDGQVLGRYVTPDVPLKYPGNVLNRDSISIGEATTLSCGYKSVDQGDAVAIQAAEMRAIGTNEITPSGVASMAQSAANVNPRIMRDKNKTTLYDVLADTTTRLPMGKAMTCEDAEGLIDAKIRNKLDMSTTPSGVATSMSAVVRINQSK